MMDVQSSQFDDRRARCAFLGVALILLCSMMIWGCGSDSITKGKRASDNNTPGENTTTDGGFPDSALPDMGQGDGFTDAADQGGDASDESPCIELSDSEIDFGPATVGEVTRRVVTLRNCSSQALLSVTSVRIEDDPSSAFSTDFIDLSEVPFNLGAQNDVGIGVLFEPGAEVGYSGTLVVETNDPVRGRSDITLRGSGTAVPCPVVAAKAKFGGLSASNLTVEPFITVNLDGSMSSSSTGPIDTWEWSIVGQPAGSRARLEPSSDIVDPEVWLDLVGTYTLELEVESSGVRSCSPARVTIEAVPTQDVYIQLFWDSPMAPTPTPGVNGIDLDLHYLRGHPDAQWNQPPWSVYWDHRSATWGGQVELINDSVNRLEPEVTTHESPEQGVVHRVGVYYYGSPLSEAQPSATVEIYFDGVKGFEDREVPLPRSTQFWQVAEFVGGSTTATQLGGISEGFP